MAKDKIEIDIKVDDNGTTQKATLNSKKAGQEFDKTTEKADKYHKGQKGVAQATANSTKAFSKMQGGMTGMVGVYAEIASRVFALSAAFQFLKNASDVTNLIAGQEAMGAATGVAYKSLTEDLKAATDGQLAYADAARAAAIGTAAGLSASQLSQIGTAARNVSNALGRDLRDSFERLTRGITKAEPELLDELGIILRLETAKKNYAAQIGKTASTLTQFEQSQAIANEVLTQAEEKFGKIEELMDPSAASLNRFLTSFDDLMNSLKTGSMTVLRPVFDFLSQNTMALVGTLGLLGTTVLRSILPNMTEWRNSSRAAADSAREDMLRYRGQLDAAKRSLQEFNVAQQASKANAASLASRAMGDFGTVTKGGGGAKDFFSGMSDTKRARANAKRVLEAAEREYEQFGRVTTGMLKGYNAQQLADMRASYNMRAAILDQTKQKHKITIDSMKLHWSVLKTHAIAQLSAIKAAMSGFAAFATKWGGRIMSAFGWGSLIMMAVGFVKNLMDKGLPQHLKDANNEAEAFTDKLTTLNDELRRMDDVQTAGLLSTRELTSQIGKATASADLHAQVVKFQSTILTASAQKTEEARKALLGTATALSKLDPRYKTYLDLLKQNGSLTKEQLIDLKNVTNSMIEQGNAVDNLANATKAFGDAIRAMNTGVKPMNPFLEILNTANILKDTIGTSILGEKNILENVMPQEFLTAQKNIQKAQQAHVHKGTEGRGFFKTSFDNLLGGQKADENLRTRLVEHQGGTVFDSQADKDTAIDAANAALDEQQKKLTEGQKSLVELEKKYTDIEGLIKSINEKSGETVTLAYEDVSLKDHNRQLMNRGITIQERLNNLQISANNDKMKENDLQKKLLAAELKLEAAERDKSENKQALIQAATHELIVANQNLDVEKRRAQIQKEIRKDKEAQLELEKALNPLIASRNAQEIALMQQQRLKKDIDSGANDFGFTQAALSRQQEGVILSNRVAIAQGKQLELQTKLDKISSGKIKKTVKETQALKHQLKVSRQNVANAQQALEIHNAAVKIAENTRNAQIEELQFRNEMFSLNPLQEEFNKAILDMKKQGINLTQQEQDLLVQQLQTMKDQKDMLERKEALKSAIGDNLASVIADAIRGNITSFKDAIKQLAEGILNDMVDIISRQLAQKILNFLAPGLFSSPAATMAAAHSAGATAIGTAITTNAGTAATTIGTAITTGTTTLTTGLATAFTTGAATLTAAIAAACAACSMGCSGGGTGGEEGGSSLFESTTRPSETGIDTGIGTIDAAGQAKKLGSEGLKESMNEAREQLKEDLKNSVKEGLNIGMPKALEAGGPKLGQSLADKFTNFADKLGGNLKDMLGSTLNNLMGGLDGLLSGVMSNLGGMLQGLGSGLGSLLGSIGGGIGSLFGMFFADGGIASYGRKMPGYSTGGIARGSKAGYPAVLHGTEAVVPLPNGKSIPVEMSSNTSNTQQTNNISISIATDGSSKESSDGDKENANLGRAISQAVQQELQNQKRSGGILSPYGVA